MTSKKDIREIMKLIIWDYNIDPYKLYEVVIGKRDRIGQFNAQKVLVRMLERLTWYDLLELLGIDFIKKSLSKEIINKIRFKDLKNKYEFTRKVLQGEPVSFSGWSIEARKRVKHTLLSNRWYRA